MGFLPNYQILDAFRWGSLRHLSPVSWLLTPVLLHLFKIRPQPGIRAVKRFRHHAGLVEDGQTARVPGPAGNDLYMEVLGKSRACDLADIYAYVQPLRLHFLLQDIHRCLGELHEITQLVDGQIVNVSYVSVRHHEQMAVVIRVKIHDDEGVLPAIENVVLAVVILLQFLAEETASFLF